MALTATVSKKSVTKIMDKMWHITLNLILMDNSMEVLNNDYSIRYRIGDSIPEKTVKFITLMQGDIDKYKGEQNIFTHVQLDAVVINVQAGLEV